MKVKNVVIISCLLLTMLILSCAKSPKEGYLDETEEMKEFTPYEDTIKSERLPDTTVTSRGTISEKEKVKEYAQIIENILLKNHFLGHGIPLQHSRGIVEVVLLLF